ncbi:MAG TPA: 3-oxoacyl-[acyl-carrier-protein] synthase III C-terminal domain-containing protein [Pseudonocardiaceae bacterium]|jgi:3-oxoacyl-[acyl-carrier-protein] synthase-3|nr:3-oxoacyl-[acyl-carrier-protein] synthase III C-terminal domain-containing protein [Pseudonocardiaceae bacterium]
MDEYLAQAGRTAAANHAGYGPVDLKVSPTLDTGDALEELLVAVGLRACQDDPVGLVLYGHALPAPRFGTEPGLADRVRVGLGLAGVPFFGISGVGGTSVLRALDYARRYLERRAAYDVPGYDGVLVLGGDNGTVVDSARHAPGTTELADTVVAFLVRPDSAVGGVDAAGRYRYLAGATSRDARFHRGQRLGPVRQRLFDQVCAVQVLATANSAMRQAGLTGADVDWVMPQASAALSWRVFAKSLGVEPDRVRLDLIPAGGHTHGVDALVALANAERADQLTPGQRCLLLGIGDGAYFQAAVVEVTPDRGWVI